MKKSTTLAALGLTVAAAAVVRCSNRGSDAAAQLVSEPESMAARAAAVQLTSWPQPAPLDSSVALLPALARSAAPVASAPAFAEGFDRRGEMLIPRFAETARHRVEVRLPARAHLPFALEDVDSGVSVEVALDGASTAAAAAGSGHLVYEGAWQGANLLRRATVDGAEDFIVLDSAPARTEASWILNPGKRVAGLRLVASTLEFLDDRGAPRLRMAAPFIIDAKGERHAATVAVEGCRYDSNAAAPWDRPPVAPGSEACRIRVSWPRTGVPYPAVLDPSWTATGAMSTARMLHTATVLTDGRVLVVGGRAANLDLRAECEIFDPATKTWAGTGPLTVGHSQHAAVRLASGKVLVAGGIYFNSVDSNLYVDRTAFVWDPATGLWSSTGSMATFRGYGHTLTLLGSGKALVVGGFTAVGSSVTASAELWDPVSGLWTTGGTMATARFSHSTTTLSNGTLLVAGGSANGSGSTCTNTAEIYDPATNGWSSTTGAMSNAREMHGALLLPSNEVLVAGGYTGSAFFNGCEIYDPVAKTFAPTGALPFGRMEHVLLMAGSGAGARALLAGGDGQNATETYTYDRAGGAWTLAGTLTSWRGSLAGAAISAGRVLAIGGTADGSNGLKTVDLFDFVTNGLACTVGGECLSGFCADTVCCDKLCGGKCDVCKQTLGAGSDGVCTNISGAGTPSCAPYLCLGATPGCPTSCTLDAQCSTGNVCAGGACMAPQANGAACTVNKGCVSGFCADLVCCDKACDGACDACAAALGATKNGTCTNVSGPGNPSCTPYLCVGAGVDCPTSCTADAQCATGNVCVGVACKPPLPKGSACAKISDCVSGFCADLICCDAACDGACDVCAAALGATADGTCSGITGITGNPSCSPYLCKAASPACPTSCASDTDCASNHHCDATGKCVGNAANGQPCSAANACASGFCVDGVCCDTACAGGVANDCQACSVATGSSADGTCDSLTGASCDDGLACTQTDTCAAGVCQGVAIVCTAKDSCNPAGACDPATGTCSQPVLPDGSACTSDLCMQGQACQGGVCGGGTVAVTCAALDDCHDVGTCDPATGICSDPLLANGTKCSKGVCNSGKCGNPPIGHEDHCSCGAGPGAGAVSATWGVLAFLAGAMRRRRFEPRA